jgi:mono/diheme cytochrome c family protein
MQSISPVAFVDGFMLNGMKLNGRTPVANEGKLKSLDQMKQLPSEDRAAIYAYLSGKALDPTQVKGVGNDGLALKTVLVGSDKNAAAPSRPLVSETGATGVMQHVQLMCAAPEPVATANIVQATAEQSIPLAIETAADRVMDQSCRTCHGPGARNEKTFPMHDITSMAADPKVVVPGNPERSNLFQSIALSRMPIGTQLKAEEVDAIRDWINALGEVEEAPEPSTPSPQLKTSHTPVEMLKFIPVDFSQLMLSAMADLNEQHRRDRSYIRYFSFANTPLPEIDCDWPEEKRNPVRYLHAALNKFINSVSRENQLQKVTPVEGTQGALVRVDIRDFGWDVDDWRALSEGVFTRGAQQAGFSQNAWNELAEIYPYGLDSHSDAFLSALSKGTDTAIPVLDASWFTHYAASSPYYDMLLRLPENIRQLENRLGIDVDREILRVNMARAGFAESGVSDHNRMIERFDLGRRGYYWKSYDFAGDDGRQLLTKFPDGPEWLPGGNASQTESFEHDGGEMIFSLANGLQGYYLSTADGDRLLVGPTNIVSFRNKPIGRGIEILNARSCFDCHENGIIRKNDELRDHIKVSNSFDLEQQKVLLEMYLESPEMDDLYQRDIGNFIDALEEIDAAEENAAGNMVSMRAPTPQGGAELVTFLADLQFISLDQEAVARSFYLSPQEFEERVDTMGDAHLMRIAQGWVNRFKAGHEIARVELDEVFAAMLPRLTDFDPFAYAERDFERLAANEEYEDKVVEALEKKETQIAGNYAYEPDLENVPEFKPEINRENSLALAMSVPKVNVRVDDLLEFDITATRRCELQILYVEETRKVEELPQDVLGPAYLEAGEKRRIPYPGSGFRLRFDTPGKGETMVAFCKEGGLGADRIDGDAAMKYAREHFQPLSRGLVVERVNTVEESAGKSAVHAITFQVSK